MPRPPRCRPACPSSGPGGSGPHQTGQSSSPDPRHGGDLWSGESYYLPIDVVLAITISSHLGNPAIRQRHGGVQPEGGGPVEVVGVGLGREPEQVGGGLQLPEDVPLTGAPDTSHNFVELKTNRRRRKDCETSIFAKVRFQL